MKWFSYLKQDSQDKLNKLNQIKLPKLNLYNQSDLKYLFLFFKKNFNIKNNDILIGTKNKKFPQKYMSYIGGEITLQNENIEYETSYKFMNHYIKYYHQQNDLSYNNLLNQRIFTMFNI